MRVLICISFSLFASECLYHCPLILWLIVFAYLVFIVIFIVLLSENPHWYSAILWLTVRVYVRLVIHVFLLYIGMPLWVFVCIVTDFPCISSSLDPHFSSFFSLSVSIFAYIPANSTCICTSLQLPVFPAHFLSFNVYTSVRIYHHSFLMYMFVSWSVFLSLFLYDCLCLCSAILSLIVRIRLLFRVFVYLSIPLSLSLSGYIIGNLHVCEQASSTRSVCSSAVENICIIINSASIRTFLDHTSVSLSLTLNVRSRVRICYVRMRLLMTLFFSSSLCIHCSSVQLYCHWLLVYIFVSWSVFLSLFLSEYLYQCSAILSLIVRE